MGMFLHTTSKRLAVGGAVKAEKTVNGVFSSGSSTWLVTLPRLTVSSVVNLKENCKLLSR